MVASPSTIGGISENTVISPNAATHIHVMAVVMYRKPPLAAVRASTVATAYSRTNGRPIRAPTAAIANNPKLLTG